MLSLDQLNDFFENSFRRNATEQVCNHPDLVRQTATCSGTADELLMAMFDADHVDGAPFHSGRISAQCPLINLLPSQKLVGVTGLHEASVQCGLCEPVIWCDHGNH